MKKFSNITASLAIVIVIIIWMSFAPWTGDGVIAIADITVRAIIGIITAYLVLRGLNIANKRAKTADRTANNETYVAAVKLMSDENDAIIMGGLVALEELANNHPKDNLIKVLRFLTGYVRSESPLVKGDNEKTKTPETIATIGRITQHKKYDELKNQLFEGKSLRPLGR